MAHPPSEHAGEGHDPHFVAEVRADADVAQHAWQAASACTGWRAPSHHIVQVQRGPIHGGFLGKAHYDHDGLYAIELDPAARRTSEVLFHEIAHAWVHEGPPALVEGRTELLADCMVRMKPGVAPLQWDDGRDLSAMPDLRRWLNPDHGPSALASVRTDGYLGAARLMRTVALVVPERDLWKQGEAMDWTEFYGMLEQAGPQGARIRNALAGGRTIQQNALSDADEDGQPRLAEEILGTSPDHWDTDRDGWWDGAVTAHAPGHAQPLPWDGTPKCTGWATSPEGGVVRLVSSGDVRGHPSPRAVMRAGHDRFTNSVMAMNQTSLLVELAGPRNNVIGGLWATVEGDDLVNDDACFTTPLTTVWATDRSQRDIVSAFNDALQRAMVRADIALGPEPGRVAVALGGRATRLEDGVIHLSTSKVMLAGQIEAGLDALASFAVAIHRASQTDSLRWHIVGALARSINGDPDRGETFLPARQDALVSLVTSQARRCGWNSVLDGTCPDL